MFGFNVTQSFPHFFDRNTMPEEEGRLFIAQHLNRWKLRLVTAFEVNLEVTWFHKFVTTIGNTLILFSTLQIITFWKLLNVRELRIGCWK